MHVKTITVTGNITWLNTGRTTTVTAIDASRMPSLLFLECNYENLTALDVTKNTALTDLSCGGNRLSTLDINKNTNLEFMYCAENQLTALDISKNTALKYLFVNGNKLSASALKAIFSALPSCTTEDACYVHCHDNPGYPELTEADLAIATARGWEVTE
jgi:Leucine-rich repeat (LRR) protein